MVTMHDDDTLMASRFWMMVFVDTVGGVCTTPKTQKGYRMTNVLLLKQPHPHMWSGVVLACNSVLQSTCLLSGHVRDMRECMCLDQVHTGHGCMAPCHYAAVVHAQPLLKHMQMPHKHIQTTAHQELQYIKPQCSVCQDGSTCCRMSLPTTSGPSVLSSPVWRWFIPFGRADRGSSLASKDTLALPAASPLVLD